MTWFRRMTNWLDTYSKENPRAARLRQWLLQRDLELYGGLFFVMCLLYAFLEIAEEVDESEGVNIDLWVVSAVRGSEVLELKRGPNLMEGFWLDITSLGSWPVVTLFAVFVVGYLTLIRNFRTALALVLAFAGAALLSVLLKDLFGRPRPELASPFAYVTSYSFPSGHSTAAAAVYPALGSVVVRLVRPEKGKLYIAVGSLLLMLLVGFSRVYLGVHYLTDVVAGWCVGLGWATLCWLAFRMFPARSPSTDAPRSSESCT